MRVYKFRLLGDLPPEAIEELHRTHVLKNQLVETHKRHAERVAEIWQRFPELNQIIEQRETAEAELQDLLAKAKDAKVKARSTVIASEVRAAVKEKRTEIREIRARLRDAKARTLLEAKPLLHEAGSQRRQEIKDLYRPSVDGGLYWANYNESVQRHETAIKMMNERRKQGQPADLRFRSWDGTGTLTVQLQREAKKPPRSPELLASEESPWRNVASLTPVHDPAKKVRRRDRLGTLRFRIGAGDHASVVEMPVLVHRAIPLEADVTLVRVSRRRIGARFRCSVSVVVRLPEIPARTSGDLVAVHSGWRALGDGSIRVAVVRGAGAPPESLSHSVRSHGDWYEVVAPARWMSAQERMEKLRSTRDTNLDLLRQDLVAWLKEHPQDDERLDHVDRWRSPRRFAALALQWRDQPPEGGEDIARELEAWRKQDRHLWEWEANERDRIAAHRDDTWRNVAAWLTTNAGLVLLDGWDVQPLVRTPAPEDPDSWQERAARANRGLTAPALLRSRIEATADRRGVRVETVGGAISQTHFGCGGELDPMERQQRLMVRCPACNQMVDQDYNASEHLLASATA